MKAMHALVMVSTAYTSAWYATAQGTFQDLNFEEANIVPIAGQPYAVTIANALPGWTVDYGTFQQSQITYNEVSLGGTAATLLANGYSTLTGELPIDGSFSILLYGGLMPISISQTGQIPSGTQSLLFDWVGVGPLPELSIGNDSLSLFQVGRGTGEGGVPYSILGANISAWAGQTEQLSFTMPGSSGPSRFDDISFSPGAIPEPSTLALTGIGGVLFALYRRFALNRR